MRASQTISRLRNLIWSHLAGTCKNSNILVSGIFSIHTRKHVCFSSNKYIKGLEYWSDMEKMGNWLSGCILNMLNEEFMLLKRNYLNIKFKFKLLRSSNVVAVHSKNWMLTVCAREIPGATSWWRTPGQKKKRVYRHNVMLKQIRIGWSAFFGRMTVNSHNYTPRNEVRGGGGILESPCLSVDARAVR